MAIEIDYDFLASLEGSCRLEGYVPDADNSGSGVTVATGFDLGARNTYDMERLGINGELLTKLKPYLGLKGKPALDKLGSTPLSINDTECLFINKAVKAHFTAQLTSKYDNAIVSGRLTFDSLPTQAQTVIASVSYQYGINIDQKTPKFWEAVTSQDWTKTVEILENFGDRYKTRRKKEAERLKEIITTSVKP